MEDPECEIPPDEIRQNDVVFGRGKGFFHNHKGNVGYREMVRARAHQYRSQESRSFDRDSIAKEILRSVHDVGGRFLHCIGESWVECPHHTARSKVRQALRDMKIHDHTKRSPRQRRERSTCSRHSSSQKGTKRDVQECPHRSADISSDCTSIEPNDDLLGVGLHKLGSNDNRLGQTRSSRNNEAAFDSGEEEVFHGWKHDFHSDKSNVVSPVVLGAEWNLFPPPSHTFDQQSLLRRHELQAYPSFPLPSVLYSREVASLQICYAELVRGQGSSTSALDRETIEILRRLQQS